MSDSTKCLRVWYGAYTLRLFYIFNIGQPTIFQVESFVSRWLSNSHYLMLAVSRETFFINSLKQFAEAFPRVKNSDVLLSVSRRLCWYLCRRLCWYLCRRLCWYLCCLKSDLYRCFILPWHENRNIDTFYCICSLFLSFPGISLF